MLLYDGGVQTKPSSLVYGVKTALFCCVCKRERERDGKGEEPSSFLKTEFSGENEGLVCVTSLCEVFLFLLSLH